MTPGDDDWRGSNPIEPPGLLQAAKHGSVDTWKWDESLSRDRAAGQDDNGIVGLDLGRIDERRVARFEWIAKDIAKNPAVERDDQTEGDEEKFSCPAPAPKDQDHQQHEHPRHGREDQCFEELLEDKHAPLVVNVFLLSLAERVKRRNKTMIRMLAILRRVVFPVPRRQRVAVRCRHFRFAATWDTRKDRSQNAARWPVAVRDIYPPRLASR